MVDNIHGIKHRCFGIEIELTGITRCQAAQAVADLFGTYVSHNGGYYDKYTVSDNQNREWSFVFDSNIDAVNNNRESAGDSYKVELNSPVLCYEDIPLLQEVIRALRHIGGVTGPNYCCGTHIHISADDYTPQQIRNLVNIFSSKENYLWDALQISSARSTYCRKSDPEFIQNINRLKPKTMQKIQNLWYKGDEDEINTHYSSTRYHALNLHSFFQHGHYEIRCANASLHAGEVRAQIVLALAINNAAMTKKYCSPTPSYSDNMRYSFRVWLLNLGLIGEEFKNCRMHLLKHLSGNIAWRHPEDAIAQKEKLKEKRNAERENCIATASAANEQTEELSIPNLINCVIVGKDKYIIPMKFLKTHIFLQKSMEKYMYIYGL